eukprot:jgi/Chlat1/7531/Chrsp62S07038
MAAATEAAEAQGKAVRDVMRETFPAFPYEAPYDIQLGLMRAAYETLQRGGVALLESPTGTVRLVDACFAVHGKTLSLICSVLQWLVDQRQVLDDGSLKNNDNAPSTSDAEPDWLSGTTNDKRKRRERRLQTAEHWQARLAAARQAIKQIQQRGARKGSSVADFMDGARSSQHKTSRAQRVSVDGKAASDSDAEHLPEEWDSDAESAKASSKRRAMDDGFESSSDESDLSTVEEEAKEEGTPKVYFCSRTHSQLSQFIGELKRTPFGNYAGGAVGSESTAHRTNTTDNMQFVRTTALGARKTLCIKPDVAQLSSASRVNEACLQLQKNAKTTSKAAREAGRDNISTEGSRKRKSSACGCPYLTGRRHAVQQLSDAVLVLTVSVCCSWMLEAC